MTLHNLYRLTRVLRLRRRRREMMTDKGSELPTINARQGASFRRVSHCQIGNGILGRIQWRLQCTLHILAIIDVNSVGGVHRFYRIVDSGGAAQRTSQPINSGLASIRRHINEFWYCRRS